MNSYTQSGIIEYGEVFYYGKDEKNSGGRRGLLCGL
jgi:hypothetical protein